MPKKKSKRSLLLSDPELAQERERLATAIIQTLRGARQDADLTQAQMAYSLGWTEDKYANVESQRTPVSWADAILCARLANMETEELFAEFLRRLSKPSGRRSFPRDPARR